MSRHAFDPACPDCRPAILDHKTGKRLGPGDPIFEAAQNIWDAQPRDVQEAWHAVCVHNSRRPRLVSKAAFFVALLERAMRAN